MAASSETAADHPLDEMEDGFWRWARTSTERLAYTRRGNFAFLVGTLLSILHLTDQAVTAGTPTAEAMTAGVGPYFGLIDAALTVLSGTITVLLAITAGILVLLILDLYEHHVGLAIGPE